MGKGGKRFGKATPPRSLSEESKSNQVWWWIGGAAGVILVGAVAGWFAVGSSRSPLPAATASATERVEAASPVASGASAEPSEKEVSSMPENPEERNDMYSAPPEMHIDPGKTYAATIVTEKGDIVLQLDARAAPNTVNNFVFLAREGFYDGLTFHRVVPGFVIQGGDPAGTGGGGPGYTVAAEIELEHGKGAVAMARRPDEVNPEQASSGSQFYITLAETPHLDGAYTVFGEVVKGMDVVESIVEGDTIESITIEEE